MGQHWTCQTSASLVVVDLPGVGQNLRTVARHHGRSEVQPGATITDDEELARFARTNVTTYHHPVGNTKVQGPIAPKHRERGEFDDLPGAGKPLKGLDGRHDPDWWTKQKMAEEDLASVVATAKTLRQEAEQLMKTVGYESSEADVREIVTDLNKRIKENRRRRADSPRDALLRPFDVEAVVKQWREQRK